ncbi:hypothetical protein [Paraburkholderia silvatlantica]|uniref:hypothetical protein n=1 Tax=Paraburkholderia silvatlantica TaxID=321895 RepID=UPI0010612E8E|nr:hypothetical protein [Paraburkholderia silvatlantica]TDR04342.1 hypothetical protein C7412_102248 [Paraburkholderia silvatlantica]
MSPAKKTQPVPAPYYALPCALQLCDEVIALSSNAHRLLHQIAALHHGFDNGHIALPRATARLLGWRSHDTFERALCELLNAGLLFQTRPATGRRSRLFALAWLPVPKVQGLMFVPAAPVPMPGMAAVMAALKSLKKPGGGETWSLKTGAFVACVPGHKKKHAACLPGHKPELAACVAGHENQLWPGVQATNGGLRPDGRATNSAHVYRCYGVDAQRTDTPEPDLPTVTKQGGVA